VTNEDIAILVVAAGRGLRAGAGAPKQYRAVGGESVLARTLRVLAKALPASPIQVVIHPDDADLYRGSVAQLGPDRIKILAPTMGGATRQASVLAGLESLNAT
jgi:2-C-methyl-D-erythritol 4-phosphate cytidylyltransferase/2-C-methyl-D-erythritol 2,4-cyclodiphosphate synthase